MNDATTVREEWRPVFGFEGLYEVSDQGRVRGIPRCGSHGQPLRPSTRGNGYKFVCLSANGVVTGHPVHRLVARAFVPVDDGRQMVNHRNGDKADNRAVNLEWVTHGENMHHAFAVLGAVRSAKGRPARNRKLNAGQVRAIRNDSRSASELAGLYGVGHTTISNVKLGKYYSDVD